jgi:capsular exopolysaccharide synthesis family protein
MTEISSSASSSAEIWDEPRSAAGFSDASDSYGENGAGGFSLNIPLIMATIRRNLIPIVGIIAICVLLGIAVTLLSTRIYRGSAVVQIEQTSDNVVDTQSVDASTPIADSTRFLETQKAILASRTLAGEVAQRLNLYNNNFIVRMGGDPLSSANASAQDPVMQNAVIGLLRKNMTLDLPGNSRAATISFDSPNPALSASVADGYAASYMDQNLAHKSAGATYARTFILQQLNLTQRALEASQRKAIAYAQSAGLIAIGPTSGGGANDGGSDSAAGTLSTSTLVQLNNAYGDAQAERIRAQQRWESAKKTPLMNIPEVLANPAVQSMFQKRADLRSNLQDQKQRYKAGHPIILQLSAQIAELDGEIQHQATNIKNSFEQTYLSDVKQEEALKSSVSGLRGDALGDQQKEIELNILERDANTNRSLYNALLQRYKELTVSAGIETNNLSLIDPAVITHSPIHPKPFINLAVALLAGVVLAALFVAGRELLDDAIRTPDDVARKLDVPVLGTIPVTKGELRPIDELKDPRSALSEAYYSLRTALEFSTPQGLPRVLTFTSSRPSEGKSTSALATAQNLARIGKRVLLVDADLRLPSLHRQLQLKNNGGFVSQLTAQQPLIEVVQKLDGENLDFLASGPLPPNPTDLLSNFALGRFFQIALASYDVLVVDCPPVMGFADSLQLASMAEGVVFVVDSNVGHRGAAKQALKRLASSHAPVLGVLLTKFDADASGYGYGYGYGYSYSYGGDEKRTN